MKWAYFLSILFLTPLFTFAQSNFKPGYIVGLSGDTVRGSIDYREWESNPTYAVFRGPDNTEQKITVQNATAFGITGIEHYQHYTVGISQSPLNVSNLITPDRARTITADVFLKTIVKGNIISLFSFTDDIKTRYYFLTSPDTTPQELEYGKFISYESGSQIAIVTTYKEQLRQVVLQHNLDKPRLLNTIKGANYTENDFIKVANTINGANNTLYITKSTSGVRFFVGTGLSRNRFVINGRTFFPKGTNRISSGPYATLGLDVIPNVITQRFFFRIDASYYGSKYSFVDVPNGVASVYIPTGTLKDLKQTNVVVAPQAVYNVYSGKTVEVFLAGGFGINFSHYSAHDLRITFNTGGETTKRDYPDFNTTWYSFPLKAGVTFNRNIQVIAGYLIGATSLDSERSINASLGSFQAGVNYIFK